MPENSRGGTLCRAITTCVRPDDDALAALGTFFTDDAIVWSPNLFCVGLADLAEVLAVRESALSGVDIQFSSVGVIGNKAFAEFTIGATFAGPFVIDDDVVIEPNGRQLLLGAAAVADFEGDRITALRAYFDDATLLEQMLAPAT
jgi:SnoaL-like domain